MFLSRVRWFLFLALAAVFSVLAAADSSSIAKRSGINPILRHTTPNADSQRTLPAGLTLVDWKQIKAEYENHRHGMFPDGKGGYQSRSHYHGWLVRFDGRGFEVDPDTESWTWGLELASWGRDGAEMVVTERPQVHMDVNRLEYRRKDITEWFVNGKEGLEHGFTIAQRPGAVGSEVSMRFRQRGSLVASGVQDSRNILYKTEDGQLALNYRKLLVVDAVGRYLLASILVEGGQLRIAFDDRLATYPITVDPIVQQSYLKAPNARVSDSFGSSVAVSGETVAVGAYGEDSDAVGVNGNQSGTFAPDAGAVYVFARVSNVWGFQAYIKPFNTEAYDGFGYAVAISGNTIVVGAPGEDGSSVRVNGPNNNLAQGSGAAYVFVRNGNQWSQQAYLKAADATAYDSFGYSVSVSGDAAVVGAPGKARRLTSGGVSVGYANAGSAYVYARDTAGWDYQVSLVGSNTEGCIGCVSYASLFAGDSFGFSVSLSGDTVVVGAPGEGSNATGVNNNAADNSASNSGAAYVFVRQAGGWSEQAYLKASNTEAGDQFGYSVAISGNTAVIGSRNEDSASSGVNGSQGNNSAVDSGAAYVYSRTGSAWALQAYLKSSNPDGRGFFGSPGDRFGSAVGVDGDCIVVGAHLEDSRALGVDGIQSDNSAADAGAVYVFGRVGTAWRQYSYLKASNTGAGDWFGYSVAVSGDTIISGAIGEDSAAAAAGNVDDNTLLDAGAGYVFLAVPSITPTTESVPAVAVGGRTVLVSSEPWVRWAVVSNAGWLSITSGSIGSGTGVVTFDVTANPSSIARVGTLTIGGQPFTVNQAGTPTFAISKTADAAPMGGGAGRTVTVTATPGFAWTATTTATWITITGGASGSGNGTVTYTVQANTGTGSRSGVITVGGQTVTVTQSGPTPIVTGPIAGSGTSNIFTFTFNHPEGFARLGVVNVLINRALDGGRACYLAYSQPYQLLFLVDDNGPDAGLSVLSLGGSGSASNSQCTVRASGSSASTSGNALTLRLNIEFKAAFAGNRVIYLAAREDGAGGANSGWLTQGAWNVPGAPVTYPRSGGMTPATGMSSNAVISYTFDDQTNANNLQTVWSLINSAVDAGQACYVAYYVPGNLLFLYPDNGNGAEATFIDLSGTNTIENSQCRISAVGSSVTRSGQRLTLNLNTTFKSSFSGPRGVWTAAQPLAGTPSAWTVLGNWLVP